MPNETPPSAGGDQHERFLEIQAMLIDALVKANYPVPITPLTKISDLTSNVVPIVRLINKTFFPDDRFTTAKISGSDTISNVSLTILKLPTNV